MMRKLVGCAALLISSAVWLPGVAAARDRYDAPVRYEQQDRHDSQERREYRERITTERHDGNDSARREIGINRRRSDDSEQLRGGVSEGRAER
jgi:hypothetical protein